MVTLDKIHSFVVEEGIKKDPRERDQIDRELEDREEEFENMDDSRKEMFDEDRLENPFDDSKVIYGGDRDVEKVAVGIDIETEDLLLVDRLNEKGKNIDGVVAHHPTGLALSLLHEVMDLQVDTLREAGISVSQAEGIVKSRTDEVKKSLHSSNHSRVPRAAELLDIPMMNMHTITDNHAYRFMEDYLEEKDPRTLGDIVDSILELPEYKWSLKFEMGPEIYTGSKDNRVGKMEVLGFTGGTGLDENLIESMVNSGIDTLIAMHAKKKQIKKAKKENINIVSPGHMPSDSLGMNLVLDKVKDEYSIETVSMSGFKRVERKE